MRLTLRRFATATAALFCAGGLASAQTFAPYGTGKSSARAEGIGLSVEADASVVLPKGPAAFEVIVPTPAGELATLTVSEASVFHPDMQARYPDIRTYRGLDERGHPAAVTQGPSGIQVFVEDGPRSYAITAAGGSDGVLRYLADEATGTEPALGCGYAPDLASAIGAARALDDDGRDRPGDKSAAKAQVNKRVYTMALASTGEFSLNRGGTVESVNEAFAEALNILNAMLLTETALEFQLHPDNDTLIFLNPGLDPYREPTLGRQLLRENVAAINSRIPVEEYGIGHVFTNGCSDVSGVVSGRTCDDDGKARGVTCIGGSLPRAVRNTMTHEVAHQFAVSHTWNNCPGNDPQRSGFGAFEPGSGTTIMSYQGACGSNNIPGQGDYYHVGSLQQFRDYYTDDLGAACADVVPIDNELPEVSAPGIDGLTIPMMTPFVLEGSAVDPDGDRVLFTWEQYDLGNAVDLCDQDEGSPLFRSLPPTTDGNVRYFPDLQTVRTNGFDCAEQLPRFGRDLTFRLTARDRNPIGGGTDWVEVGMRVDGDAGPFRITSQPGGTVFAAGAFVPVEWDVAGTDAGDIGVTAVDILLSTDGGRTFPTTLVEGTLNDGSEGVTLPADLETSVARFLVRPVGNVFYAMSPNNFQVVIPTEPGFTFAPSQTTTFLCLPPAGEPSAAEIDFFTSSLLGFEGAIDVAIEGDLPAGVTADFTRTTLQPGEDTRLTLDFTDYDETAEITVEVVATSDGLEAARRTLLFDVVSNNFSDLELLGPVNGATGVSGVPTFAFTPSRRADVHVLELSADPSFGFERITIEDPDPSGEQLGFLLEPNTVYFWRVRPINRCIGDELGLPVNAFQTFATDCRQFSNEDPIRIPANFSGDLEIPVQVDDSGPATDINVPLVDIRFTSINQLDVELRSPAGTNVILHRRRCGGNVLRTGYDDESPTELDCNFAPPTDGSLRRPAQPLSAFDGEEINGEWTLLVDVRNANPAGGSFEQFELEFCANIVSQAPTLELSDIPVPTGGSQFMSAQFLNANDPDNERAELYYIIVEAPSRGYVSRYGTRLRVGSRFTMGNVLDGGVTYVDEGSTEGRDSMRVVLSDNAGNLIATPEIQFVITDDAVTGIDELTAVDMTLAPNPTGSYSALRFGAPSQGGEVTVLDAQGRAVERVTVAAGQTAVDIDASAYAAGIYLVNYRGEEGTRTVRLVRQ